MLAVPVAPLDWTTRLGEDADELVCPHIPRDFCAIGQFYADFSQTDDEEVVGSCTKLVLESKGYRSLIFVSAEECLAEMQTDPHRCAVLVTDQTMPGMQGTELAAAMRRLNPQLPIVIMWGYFSKISPHALEALRPREHRLGVVAAPLQEILEKQRGVLLVIDDQDARGGPWSDTAIPPINA